MNYDLVTEDWLILAAVFIGVYFLIAAAINRSDLMKRHNVTMWGPVIIVRTTRGLALLDRLGRPKNALRLAASIGVPLVVAGMIYFMTLLMLMNYVMLREPPEPGSYNAPRNILLIPGLNQFIPFVWGWIALFITLLVHEFAHGILCRAEGIRVKSMGLAFVLFPVAAFVEPDEEELFGGKEGPSTASRGARIRILSAGVIANFLVAALAMALFFGPVLGAISPLDRVVVVDVTAGSIGQSAGWDRDMVVVSSDGQMISGLEQLYRNLAGMHNGTNMIVIEGDRRSRLDLPGFPKRGILVASIFEDSPAYIAGLPERSVISRMNGTSISGMEDFRRFMNNSHPGEMVTLETSKGTYKVELGSREDGTGFLGIGISGGAVYQSGVTFQAFPAEAFLSVLRSIPSAGIAGLSTLMGLPFTGIPGFTQNGFQGFGGSMSSFFEPTGWAEPIGGKLFWITNLLLWVGWINLYAGLFNCLPAVPLDGGHIFKDLIGSIVEVFVSNKEKAERVTGAVVALLAWVIFSSLLYTVLAPYLAHGIPL